MNKNSNSNLASFTEIKQNLDPSFDYIIFEKTDSTGNGANFNEAGAFITRYKKDVIKQEVHHDPTGKHHLLVVKLNVEELDEISQEIVNLSLPENITVYVYGRRPGIETA